ncbi:hypothetical protein BOH72_14025 [Mycobacterium sp. WY10]|nr:hypothetical protein BOH72_14025 [Mycobacterium sp. WY10]
MTTDDLVVEVDGVTVTDYVLLPRNPKGRPWTGIELRDNRPAWGQYYGCHGPNHGWVRVTARWGWTEVPKAIRVATAMTAAKLYDRRQNVAGAITDQRIDDVEYKWNVSALDPDVENIIATYRKQWAAV